MLTPINYNLTQAKLIEHHIERHYEYLPDTSIYLQRMSAPDEFFEHRLNRCLVMDDMVEVNEWLMEVYGSEDVVEEFEFLHYSTFTSFFRTKNVDIPRCFRKTKSVRRRVNETDMLKMNNYLMRHGKRSKAWATLSKVLNDLSPTYVGTSGQVNPKTLNWKEFYINLSLMPLSKSQPSVYVLPTDEIMSFDRQLTRVGKHIDFDWSIAQFILRNIHEVGPMFSFYVYKVDKKIFKNTRGKSGKFTFIWKYISGYKRPNLVMFWLMKELRMSPGRTLYERLYNVLNTISFDLKKSWMYRVRRFSYNYVYFNCRKTLGDTYRTVTK